MANTVRERAVPISARRVVFTCGCFDLLHIGHINLLACARELGDELIVGVHPCADRNPILPTIHRHLMVRAVCYVDHAFIHDHEDDEQIIQEFNITHWAIGPGWDKVHQRHKGVEYVIIPRVPNTSTTDIKQRCYEEVRSLHDHRRPDSGDHYHLRNP